MNRHKITYDVIETNRGVKYTATCRCGWAKEATNTGTLSTLAPRHVVTAYEKEHA